MLRIDLLGKWRSARDRRARASAYVATLLAEPSLHDVRWLAEGPAGGDMDHAQWELRYARRAAGMIVAQRDALDDRTASLVSAALARAWQRDPLVAPDRREIAARQLNTRLAAYADALAEKGGSEDTNVRLARVILGFAGRLDPSASELSAAGGLVAGYLEDASNALRSTFGPAAFGPAAEGASEEKA